MKLPSLDVQGSQDIKTATIGVQIWIETAGIFSSNMLFMLANISMQMRNICVIYIFEASLV